MGFSATQIILLVVCVLLAKVNCQQPITSSNVITPGMTFSVYCDGNRVSIPDVSIMTLNLTWSQAASTPSTTFATYSSFTFPGLNSEYKNTGGRNWNITLTGANGGVNNKNTMKIILDMYDARCSDAGLFRCSVTYLQNGQPTTTSVDRNVTATTGVSSVDLSVVPVMDTYPVGENITLTCKVTGPDTLKFSWQQFSGNDYVPLPMDAVPTTSPPVSQGGSSGCTGYSLVSTLKIQVPSGYSELTYTCSVMDNIQELGKNNITIGTSESVSQPNTGEETAEPAGTDVGMIVGIIVGCVAAIAIVIIIIVFVRYRRRSRENQDKDDQPDGNANNTVHAPPPVFYPSKVSKDEKESKMPPGMTNEALDTSYDSRDSVSKGPPRYSNTELDSQGPPRYEKESHRGRHNRGYDEEDVERNGGHGRRQPREREERKHKSRDRDYDDEPRRRYYNADDGTDRRVDMGDSNIGTSI